MLKNILICILASINIYFIMTMFGSNSINLLSFHIIAAGFTVIIAVLYLITHGSKITKILTLVTLLITSYHIYLIVMVIYNYVYVK